MHNKKKSVLAYTYVYGSVYVWELVMKFLCYFVIERQIAKSGES